IWFIEKLAKLLERGSSQTAVESSESPEQSLNTPEPKKTDKKEDVSVPGAPENQADDSIDQLKKWADKLAFLVSRLDLEPSIKHSQRGEYVHLFSARQESKRMFQEVFRTINQLASQFNSAASKPGLRLRVRLSVTREDSRVKVMTSSRCLSIRLDTGRINAYLLPASASYEIEENETTDRLKLSFVLLGEGDDNAWAVCGLPTTKNDLLFLAKALLRDLVILSCLDTVASESGKKFEQADNIHRIGIARGFKDSLSLESEISHALVQDLLVAQENTIQKLLSQQEEIQASLGRDLHDSVLADVMMLVRRLSSPEDFNRAQILEILESLSVSIREICHGLVPRDLKDWGLETVLEDLVDKAAERTQADCSFGTEGKLPDLPSAVELHIFRIVQEALNNMEKYSQAKHVDVLLAHRNGILAISVEDDGIGFNTNIDSISISKGGFGLPSLNERVEVIRAYYPTKLSIESKPGQGTKISLKLKIEHQDSFDRQSFQLET
ncbi:MAG: hypothetical protein K8F91_21665, partial [Candidatus Obscuribacterales bacterium]|nr:hypothetical protein [Candidatus Obscuribacterales bacterium]